MSLFFKKPSVSIFEPLTNAHDPRVRHIVPDWDAKSHVDVGLVGVPFDHGVLLSGGRTGAAEAPRAIRAQLKKYGTAYDSEKDLDISKLSIADLGDVPVLAKDSAGTHKKIMQAITHALKHATALIVLGGGHDISYATIRALSEAHHGSIGGMNVDAHFDVRPVVRDALTSGTSFFRLITDGLVKGKNFFEIGAQGHVNARAHRDWLFGRGAHVSFLSDVRRIGIKKLYTTFEKSTRSAEAVFISIDIDSVAQAFAPGSSAPSPDGLFPQEILELAFIAGTHDKVRLFEIMEVNPRADIDGRTSRLAANIIFNFLAGFTTRKIK